MRGREVGRVAALWRYPVNVDPVTTQRDPAIRRAIARERQACLGVYGSTVQPGRVAVGDPVAIDT